MMGAKGASFVGGGVGTAGGEFRMGNDELSKVCDRSSFWRPAVMYENAFAIW
jgi:hypothetical protein